MKTVCASLEPRHPLFDSINAAPWWRPPLLQGSPGSAPRVGAGVYLHRQCVTYLELGFRPASATFVSSVPSSVTPAIPRLLLRLRLRPLSSSSRHVCGPPSVGWRDPARSGPRLFAAAALAPGAAPRGRATRAAGDAWRFRGPRRRPKAAPPRRGCPRRRRQYRGGRHWGRCVA